MWLENKLVKIAKYYIYYVYKVVIEIVMSFPAWHIVTKINISLMWIEKHN